MTVAAEESERIARATKERRDVLVDLWRQLVHHHRALDPEYPVPSGLDPALRREIDRGLDDGDCAIWISWRGSDPVGFVFAEIEAGPADHGGLGWIHELYVVPEARRRGRASALLREAQRLFDARGIQRVAVRVESGNTVGRDFWRAHGFGEKAFILEHRSA